MEQHLRYTDETTDKFWNIEVTANSYTVSYGRQGTAGTTLTKSFGSEAQCIAAAEKQVADKLKKGYTSEGLQPAAVKSVAKKDNAALLREYDALVAQKNLNSLLPFLKENAKGNTEALKKQIRKNQRHWGEFVEINDDQHRQWRMRGDDIQKKIINLSAIALFNRSDILPWVNAFNYLNEADDTHTYNILLWAKPTWITAYFLETLRKQQWALISYHNLRLLEQKGFIEFSPELYSLALGRYINWDNKVSPQEHIEKITANTLAYERDVPQLFHYETQLHQCAYTPLAMQEPRSLWLDIFAQLCNDGKMERATIIENTVLIQTKEWNAAIKSFFRKVLHSINPLPRELVAVQENVFAALHNSLPAVVSFGVDVVKKIVKEPGFNAPSFLEWAEAIMMRSDCKTAVKSCITLLEKINKQHPELNSAICLLATDALVIPDLDIQERVAKLLLKITDGHNDDLSDKLSGYSTLMLGSIKNSLQSLITSNLPDAEDNFLHNEVYAYAPQTEQLLTRPVVLPENWNGLMYLFGSFIVSDAVIDTEILLNAYIMQQHLFPADAAIQIEPYLRQMESGHFPGIHKAFMRVFIKFMAHPTHTRIAIKDKTHSPHKTLKIINTLIEQAQNRILKNIRVPLLCFPTHHPYWIAPKVLLERLIALVSLNVKINTTDLAVAISRMRREGTTEALPLLNELSGELKELMSFCLGASNEIKINTRPHGFFNKLLSKLTSPPTDDFTELWAVAARTFYPNENFEIFENTYLKGVPFAAAPFVPQLFIKECWYNYKDYRTGQMKRSDSWPELRYKIPEDKNNVTSMLYALDLHTTEKDWHWFLANGENINYWHGLMPQNEAALACVILATSLRKSDGTAGNDTVAFLHILNSADFGTLSAATLIVLACCCFLDKKDIRMLTTEVLITLIEKQKLETSAFAKNAAFLINNNYGAFGRIADVLNNIKDVSPLHNNALLDIIERVMENMEQKEKLPVNFKKFAECYADLLHKTQQRPSDKAVAFISAYENSAAVKSLTNLILA